MAITTEVYVEIAMCGSTDILVVFSFRYRKQRQEKAPKTIRRMSYYLYGYYQDSHHRRKETSVRRPTRKSTSIVQYLLADKQEARLRERLEAEYANRIAELRAAHAKDIERLEERHAAKLTALRADLDEAKEFHNSYLKRAVAAGNLAEALVQMIRGEVKFSTTLVPKGFELLTITITGSRRQVVCRWTVLEYGEVFTVDFYRDDLIVRTVDVTNKDPDEAYTLLLDVIGEVEHSHPAEG